MQKGKFLTLLSSLNRQELSAFGKYLKQRHGSKGFIISTFRYFLKFYPAFNDDKKLSVEYAHQKIFKEPFNGNKTKLLNLLSDLFLLLKGFLLSERVNKKSFEQSALWTMILKERGLDSMFSYQVSRFQKEVDNLNRNSVIHYMVGMIANYFFYYQFTKKKLSDNISTLKDCGKDLDMLYSVVRLKVACAMANRKNLMSLDYNLEALPAILELSKSNNLFNHPILQLYLLTYELIAGGVDDNFPKIKNMLENHIGNITPEELHTVLSYLHNYSSSQIRLGNDQYWKMAHGLNQFSAEHQLFLNTGQMSAPQFNNIIQAACKTKDFTWANAFKQSHQILLENEFRINAVKLAEAIILFEQNEYKKTLKALENVKPTDLYHEIRSRSFTLISHFELTDSTIDIVGYCIAFESFLKRKHNLKMEAIEATLRFVQVVKMLAREKSGKNEITNQINSGNAIYFKSWLLKKVSIYKG